MANIKYFADIDGKTFELRYIDHRGRAGVFGTPEGVEQVFIPGVGWDRKLVKATRKIEYKQAPSKHECDARCMNATGRVMKCECACGGRNHGKGSPSIVCEAV